MARVTRRFYDVDGTQSSGEEKIGRRGQPTVGLADRRSGPRGMRLHSILPGSRMLGSRLREAVAANEEELRAG